MNLRPLFLSAIFLALATALVQGGVNRPVDPAFGGATLDRTLILGRSATDASAIGLVMPPVWTTGGTVNYQFDASRMTTSDANAFPFGGEFGFGSSNISTATVAMDGVIIPSNSTLFQVQAHASYLMNNSPTTIADTILGFLSAGGNNAGGDAINAVVSNAPNNTLGYGFSQGNAVGIESDINIYALRGGAAPSSNVYGVLVGGGSTIQPVGGFVGLRLSGAGPSTSWKYAIQTDDGASPNGLYLGTARSTGASNSQLFVQKFNNGTTSGQAYRFVNATGGLVETLGAGGQGFIVTDGTTNIIALTPAGGSISGQLNTGGLYSSTTLNLAGHFLVTGFVPTLSSCGTGPTVTGDDAGGTIKVGTGVTSCHLTFHTAYRSRPFCQFKSEASAAVNSTSLNNGGVGLAGLTPGDKIDYLCASSS